MLDLGRGSKCLVGVESLIFGAEEGEVRVVRVVVCECDNNIYCPQDSEQEKGTRVSGLPHQICPPVVERACSELACGWSLHARTNRMCTLSEMPMDWIASVEMCSSRPGQCKSSTVSRRLQSPHRLSPSVGRNPELAADGSLRCSPAPGRLKGYR